MVFSSPVFLCLFLPCTLAGYYLLHPQFRNLFLLSASLFFYAWGEPYFVLIMLVSVGANYLFALWIANNPVITGAEYASRPKQAKVALLCMVAFNLSLFFVFKYLGWTVASIARVFPLWLNVPQIALPIGISFFTFQAMSYVFDVYYGHAPVEKNPLNVALYIALFPQLIAGPIVRYRTVAESIVLRKESFACFSSGACRFTEGLAKKVLLANSFAAAADVAFSLAPSELSVLGAWIGAIAYSLQIFFDFSGYSDMAIGLGKMFGFHFEENFNYPYISRSVPEFWRRWHISLGTWFRDYVYIPLGGSRGTTLTTVRNLGVVWLLTGLWHGASWSFVAWGLYYYLLLLLHRFFLADKPRYEKLPYVIKWLATLVAVMLGWVLFRASGLRRAAGYLLCLFGLAENPGILFSDIFTLGEYAVVFVAAVLFCFPLPRKGAEALRRIPEPVPVFFRILWHTTLLAACLVILSTDGYNPFIYFNF